MQFANSVSLNVYNLWVSSFTEFVSGTQGAVVRRLPVVFFQKQTCKTTDDFRRSNNACTDKCKHLPTEQWQEDLVNKLTILSPLLYCCYATKVHALSDLLVETLVVSIGVPLSLHRRVNEICFWKASGIEFQIYCRVKVFSANLPIHDVLDPSVGVIFL